MYVNRILFNLFKEGNSSTYYIKYNMDETESSMVVTRSWREEEGGLIMVTEFLFYRRKRFRSGEG